MKQDRIRLVRGRTSSEMSLRIRVNRRSSASRGLLVVPSGFFKKDKRSSSRPIGSAHAWSPIYFIATDAKIKRPSAALQMSESCSLEGHVGEMTSQNLILISEIPSCMNLLTSALDSSSITSSSRLQLIVKSALENMNLRCGSGRL